VSPSSDDRVDRIDQFAQTQRDTPLGQGPDLILESVHRLLCGNGIEILPVQFGFDPVVGQFKLSFPTLDFESEKLEALRNVHNPGLLPVERHTELFENLSCSGQDVLRLSSSPTGHNPVVRPSRELIPAIDVKSLHAKIGKLTLAFLLPQAARNAKLMFFRRSAHQGGIAERKAMIDREHDLSITKQAEVLKISRGSVYYLPRPVSSADLAIMRHLDRLHLEFPFAGSRMLRGLLALQGCKIGRRHVKTLMRRMGIEALYRRPRTTRPEPGHKIYPYLLRGMEITRPNQVWAMDITYIPMARGFVYLAVVLDWATRRVLSWRLSITMEAALCVETLEDALARHGKPEIFNTDQGSQFTGTAFTGLLAGNGIAISMDGKGAWRDNVFVERLWRSVKYEEVYLRAYQSVSEARSSIGRYLDFYNRRRPHSSLDGSTPDQAYFNLPPFRAAA
jgi:putative transposase